MRTLPILLLAAAATLGGCATTGDRASLDPRDPMEGFNRSVWNFNQGIDKAVLKPAATAYRTVTPPPARRGISRIFANLMEPLNAANSLLQGRPDRALNSLGRFVVNSTIGVGGLADHASDLGLPPTEEDFGQTLAVWGVKNSSYLVLPLLGPSTIRDGIGTGVQFAINPPGIVLDQAGASDLIEYSVTGVQLLQARSEVIDSGVDAFLEDQRRSLCHGAGGLFPAPRSRDRQSRHQRAFHRRRGSAAQRRAAGRAAGRRCRDTAGCFAAGAGHRPRRSARSNAGCCAAANRRTRRSAAFHAGSGG